MQLRSAKPITAIASSGSVLATGSEDGVVRTYELANPRVQKAIHGLPGEIMSLAWMMPKRNNKPRELWVACLSFLYRFDFETEKLVLTEEDADSTLTPLDDFEDVLSKIVINNRGSHLAYTSENGIVGVISLSDGRKTIMRTTHSNICDCVAFLPNNPWELVSAGFDSCLLHHDFSRRTTLSQLTLDEGPTDEQPVSLAPPFILSISVSPAGNLACGLPAGGIHIAQARVPGVKKIKRPKWTALDSPGSRQQAAEGPIVGILHPDDVHVLACTMLGNMMLFQTEPEWRLIKASKLDGVHKVNVLHRWDAQLVVGGMTEAGKGVVLVLPMLDFFP